MEFVKRAIEYVKNLWGNLNTSQRVLLSAATVAVVLALVWGSSVAAGEAWARVAGHELRAEERDAVQKKLQHKGQRYEVRDGAIYVPKEDADRIMLELAGEGVVSDQAVWKFLEESDVFAPKWQLEKRYQRALQQKLEMMIRKIEGVRNASVVISDGSEAWRSGFDAPRPGVGVQVDLQQGHKLSRQNVMAIASLVARAIPGLDRDRVAVTDTQGNSYRVPKESGAALEAQDHRQYEREIEEDFESRIGKLLPHRARLVVHVVAKSKHSQTRKVTHTNPRTVDAEDRKRTEEGAAAGAAPGIKGEPSAAPAEPTQARRKETEQESREKSIVDTEDTHSVDPAGMIERATAAVTYPVEVGTDKKELQEAQARESEIRRMVQLALGGPPVADENSVQVMLVEVRKPEPIPPMPFSERAAEWLSAKWPTAALFTLALVALVVLWKVLKAAMPKAAVEDLQALTAALSEGGGLAGGAVPAAEGADVGRLKQGIRESIARNPSGAAATLKTWIGGK